MQFNLLLANRIENHVIKNAGVQKVFFGVVYDFIGSQGFDEFHIACAANTRHLGPHVPCELYRGCPDCA